MRQLNKKNTSGFTLIEILIALFIFSIVALIMTTALHNTLNAQSATEKKSAQLAALQITLSLLTRDIEQIIDRPAMTAAGTYENFTGTTNSMTFIHTGLPNPNWQLTRPTLQRTRWELNNQQQLQRLNFPLPDQANNQLPDARIFLSSIHTLTFSYLDNKGQFHSTWPPEKTEDTPPARLPRAIRISLSLENQGRLTQLIIIPAAG